MRLRMREEGPGWFQSWMRTVIGIKVLSYKVIKPALVIGLTFCALVTIREPCMESTTFDEIAQKGLDLK